MLLSNLVHGAESYWQLCLFVFLFQVVSKQKLFIRRLQYFAQVVGLCRTFNHRYISDKSWGTQLRIFTPISGFERRQKCCYIQTCSGNPAPLKLVVTRSSFYNRYSVFQSYVAMSVVERDFRGDFIVTVFGIDLYRLPLALKNKRQNLKMGWIPTCVP